MLIESIREAYREFTGDLVPGEPVVTLPSHRPAANTGDFGTNEAQARRQRRQRRQRRLERSSNHSVSGWKVRTW
jgi:hypothetical protein